MIIQSWAAGSGEVTRSPEIRSWFEGTDCRVTGTCSGNKGRYCSIPSSSGSTDQGWALVYFCSSGSSKSHL